MAVQAYPYLVMTDGTDTVTFLDGANGATNWTPIQNGWGPSIAGIRTSQLGGRGPYADVEEDISCNVYGATAALAWQNLATLTRLLDKAERWWLRNEAINPVLLYYAPQGSTINSSAAPMQAVVLGRVGSSELNGVSLPQTANNFMGLVIQGVQIACLRRGQWLGPIPTSGSGTDLRQTSTPAGNPTVATLTFTGTASDYPMPIAVRVGIGGALVNVASGVLCLGRSTTALSIAEAESGTAAGYTSVADAANLARGGSVLRYTPASTAYVTSGNITTTGSRRQLGVFAAVRNNSGTTSFVARLYLPVFGLRGPDVVIDTSSTQPRIVYLGSIVVPGASSAQLQLEIAATAASGTLDIDYLCMMELDDPVAHAVAFTGALPTTATSFAIRNPLLSNERVAVAITDTSLGNELTDVIVPKGYLGDGAIDMLTNTCCAVFLATANQYWCVPNATPASLNIAYAVTRRLAYLSPQ